MKNGRMRKSRVARRKEQGLHKRWFVQYSRTTRIASEEYFNTSLSLIWQLLEEKNLEKLTNDSI